MAHEWSEVTTWEGGSGQQMRATYKIPQKNNVEEDSGPCMKVTEDHGTFIESLVATHHSTFTKKT